MRDADHGTLCATDGYIRKPQKTPRNPQVERGSVQRSEVESPLDEISITIAFALLGLTWLTLRGMAGRERRRTRR